MIVISKGNNKKMVIKWNMRMEAETWKGRNEKQGIWKIFEMLDIGFMVCYIEEHIECVKYYIEGKIARFFFTHPLGQLLLLTN